MIDFHTHILPGIDDGSRSVEQSIKMLDMMVTDGVTHIVATPHLYPYRTTVEEFLKRRAEAFRTLIRSIDEKKYPVFYLGGEVAVCTDILEINDIQRLCIEGTNYLMIEMPYDFWSEWVFKLVEELIECHKITPIIAHIDRFIDHGLNRSGIDRLLEMNVVAQLNAESVLSVFGRGRAIKLIKDKKVAILGSDCHNDTSRAPILGDAINIIRKKLGDGAVEEIEQNGREILKGLN